MSREKWCRECGRRFDRPTGYSDAQWDARVHCGRSCASRGRIRAPRPRCSECGADGAAASIPPLCKRCYDARRYREQRDRIRETNRRWRERNPDYWRQERIRSAARERVKMWEEANPERTAEGKRRRKKWREARLRTAAIGDRSMIEDYVTVLARDPCSWCGAKADSIDHITPLAGGGEHDWTNLTAACRTCNARKWALPMLRFLAG